jgi:hypothetical protein
VEIRYLTADLAGATGGTITTDGAYTVHTFTTSGDFVAGVAATALKDIIGGGILPWAR